MSQAKHTPTPWRINTYDSKTIMDGEGHLALDLKLHLIPLPDREFILKAVNSHKKLVELLRRFVDPHGVDTPTDKEVNEALKQAEES